MTVVGLHPEELLDKLFEGEITSVERERLRAHLGSCDVCRFEYQARLDFQDEARALSAATPPPLLPLRVPQRPVRTPAPRRRSRRLVGALVAVALISASGAVASVVSGKAPWQSMSLLFARGAALEQQPATLRATPPPAKASEPESSAPKLEQAAVPLVAEPAPSPPVALATQRSKARSLAAAPPVSAPAEAASKEETEPTSAARLFAEANQARRAGDVGKASGLYHALQSQFPGSAEAELSRVTLSLLLLDSGDAQGALRGFERYLAGASRGLEADAVVGRARALGRLGRQSREAPACQEEQRKDPRSSYARQPSERLSALGLP
jgi:hypothetical protein